MLDPTAQRRFLLLLFSVAVFVGIWARVAHLDRKLFFEDETITAVRSSGNTMDRYVRIFDGKVHPVSELLTYVQRNPSAGIGTVFTTLENEDPHHAPLFYVVERLTLDAVRASSTITYRSPSVIFGLLAVGFAFALGTTLHGSKTGGGILASLVALSPFNILYSRQAREYELFTCLVFASSYSLLRAFERRTLLGWTAYAATVMLGMYTDPIFGVVVASHAVYALYTAAIAQRAFRTLGAYAIATTTGLLSFTPWALNALHSSGSVEAQLAWGENRFPLLLFAQKWAFNIAAIFFDAEFANLKLTFVALIVLAIVAASVAAVLRSGNPRLRALALPLTIIPMVPFVAYDTLHGGHFSTIPRYLTAGWAGLEIIVGGALAAGIAARSRFALGGFAFLILAGAAGAFIDNSAENWWDNNNNIAFQSVAREIDATSRPLIVLGPTYEIGLTISRYLNPDASFLLLPDDKAPALPHPTGPVFVLIPSPQLLAAMAARERGSELKNISPAPPSIIASFHETLHGDKNYKPNTSIPSLSPDDALWSLVPR